MGKSLDQLRAELVQPSDIDQEIANFLRAEIQTAGTFLEVARTELAMGNRERVRDLAGKIREAHAEMLRWIGKARDRGLDTGEFESHAFQIEGALTAIEAGAAEQA